MVICAFAATGRSEIANAVQINRSLISLLLLNVNKGLGRFRHTPSSLIPICLISSQRLPKAIDGRSSRSISLPFRSMLGCGIAGPIPKAGRSGKSNMSRFSRDSTGRLALLAADGNHIAVFRVYPLQVIIEHFSMLTAQRLRSALSYDRKTGIFRWKISRRGAVAYVLRVPLPTGVTFTLALIDASIRRAALLGYM